MTIRTVSTLIGRFCEVCGIERGQGGTALPAPLGTFPIYSKLVGVLRREGFHIDRYADDSMAIADMSARLTRRFRPRSRPRFSHLVARPELVVWPTPSIDYELECIVCSLVIRTCDGETFPASFNSRICWAISAAYPECHWIIHVTSHSKIASKQWCELGFGKLTPLSRLFEKFANDNGTLYRLARAGGGGFFNPNPSSLQFVAECDAAEVLRSWDDQVSTLQSDLEQFTSRIEV